MLNLPQGYYKVDNYLVRGKHPSPVDLYKLKKEGVNKIYDFRHHSNFGYKFVERFLCKLFGIEYTRLAYSNFSPKEYPKLDTFEKVSQEVIHNGENGGITLFHCNSGRHRTSHFSAFYKITKGKPLESVKSTLGDEYKNYRDKIILEQVDEKNYFNRKIDNYDGWNLIKKWHASFNNMIYDGLQNAHKWFLDMTK